METQLDRQVAHWCIAVSRLENLDDLVSAAAWRSLESYLGLSVRQHLHQVIGRLKRRAEWLRASVAAAETESDLSAVHRHLVGFQRQYLQTELTLDFFVDAINTRTSPKISGLLTACDVLAYRSMSQVLDQIGRPTPVVLTYLDKGRGASILKAGLRLWDGGSVNPVAAIKIVLHNLHRPTSLIHEAGHQVAHIAGWTDELAAELASGLRGDAPSELARIWASWASEIAADAFAFAHTGYASVAALHDVVAGDEASVLRYLPGDPHPISFLRVLLGVEMCRQFYGAGPWDGLERTWVRLYRIERAASRTEALFRLSLPLLPRIVAITLRTPVRAFGGRPLSALIDPGRVSVAALEELERRLGPALYTSMHWIWTESLRLLALTGLRIATAPERSLEVMKLQEVSMLRLGGIKVDGGVKAA